MRLHQLYRRHFLAGALVVVTCACSGSSGGSGSSPTAPPATASARIVSLDSVQPAGPATLVSMPEAAADLATLGFTIECEPSPGETCHIGFDFLDPDGNAIARGPGSGDHVDSAGTHTVEAAGAPKGYTGDTVGVRAYVTLGTTAVELAAVEFRRSSLRYTWVEE